MTAQVPQPPIEQTPQQPQGVTMSSRAKVTIIILVVVMVLCLGLIAGCVLLPKIMGSVVENSVVVDDPAQAAAQAREMVDYRLPPGYKELGVMNMVVVKMAILGGGDSFESGSPKPMIMIGQFPNVGNTNEEDMRKQFEESMQRSLGRQDVQLEMTGERQMTIRGQQVMVYEFSGTDQNGFQIRQIITGMFEGKSGSVMVLIVGAADYWNQQEIDNFLRSIR